MAGDWIPISLDLPRKREVFVIASRLKWSRYEVVGRLVEFWAWVSAESADGRIDGLSMDDLASVHGFDRRFLCVLLDVGWLIQDSAGLAIPNFDRWLCHSAKRRLQAAERQRRARARDPCHANVTKMSRCERDKSVTTEENSTEQYSTEDQIESSTGMHGSVQIENQDEPPLESPPQKRGGKIDWAAVVFPSGCDTPDVRSAITEWLEYRRKIGKPYRVPEKQITLLLARYGNSIVEAISHSIAQGYQGCFPPSQKGGERRDTRYAAGPGQRHPADRDQW